MMNKKEGNLRVILALIRKDKMTVSQGAKRLKIPIQRFIQMVYDAGIDLSDTDEEWEKSGKMLEKLLSQQIKKQHAL